MRSGTTGIDWDFVAKWSGFGISLMISVFGVWGAFGSHLAIVVSAVSSFLIVISSLFHKRDLYFGVYIGLYLINGGLIALGQGYWNLGNTYTSQLLLDAAEFNLSTFHFPAVTIMSAYVLGFVIDSCAGYLDKE
ncbi:TPA: hypothetical protein RQK06_002297 [Vibrio vulnificus]|uniref:hypothetical protein n=1 Tax=Vibrio rotiferianus TaxID=190895 RepID=UPI001110F17F|nr:hypothetical protein [Vibrio rotiferianus]TMX64578.1 hypothetical protein DA097_12695 [Vibrio rotiferianus]HDY7702279.1 hypothetical protein [Vibrio vulnificus]